MSQFYWISSTHVSYKCIESDFRAINYTPHHKHLPTFFPFSKIKNLTIFQNHQEHSNPNRFWTNFKSIQINPNQLKSTEINIDYYKSVQNQQDFCNSQRFCIESSSSNWVSSQSKVRIRHWRTPALITKDLRAREEEEKKQDWNRWRRWRITDLFSVLKPGINNTENTESSFPKNLTKSPVKNFR